MTAVVKIIYSIDGEVKDFVELSFENKKDASEYFTTCRTLQAETELRKLRDMDLDKNEKIRSP
jgi:hypothetical protein